MRVNRVIAVCNQKGGVGKTTTSVNTASAIAALEKRVLLIDLDPQANASQGLGYGLKKDNDIYSALCLEDNPVPFELAASFIHDTELKFLKLIPSSQDLAGLEFEINDHDNKERKLANFISSIRNEFDYILIDSPPSLNLLTINVLTAADSVLIPIQCEYYALTGLAELLKIIQLVQNNFNPGLRIEGALLTMFDSRLNLSKQVVDDVRSSFSERVFETVIPRSVRISESPSFGKPIILYDITSIGAKRYLELAEEILANG